MRLTLLRHGEPARSSLSDEGDHDPRDPGLSERGQAQAQAVRPFIERVKYDAVYASPMRRARETAELAAPGIELRIEDDLVEFDHGADYLHFEDGAAVYDRYLAGDLSAWGITLVEFHARVRGAMERLAERHPGQRVLVVGHGGFVNSWACQVAGRPDRVRILNPAYCSAHRFVREGARWKLVSLNEALAHRELSSSTRQ